MFPIYPTPICPIVPIVPGVLSFSFGLRLLPTSILTPWRAIPLPQCPSVRQGPVCLSTNQPTYRISSHAYMNHTSQDKTHSKGEKLFPSPSSSRQPSAPGTLESRTALTVSDPWEKTLRSSLVLLPLAALETTQVLSLRL